jgi:hypothetical protein
LVDHALGIEERAVLGIVREELDRKLDGGVDLAELSGKHIRDSLPELRSLLAEAGLMRP